MSENSVFFRAFAVCHGSEAPILPEGVCPVFAGAKDSGATASALSDASGENISHKNARYNELTAVYWLWKHYREIGSPEYVCVEQYRRFFAPQGEESYYEAESLDGRERALCRFLPTDAERLLAGRDFLAPCPVKCRSVRAEYAAAHGADDLRLAEEIIADVAPEYSETAKRYFDGGVSYLFNMFVFDRDTFFRYAEWIFTLLSEFEKRKPDGGRLFVSERLTGVFFAKLREEGKICRHLPVLFVSGKISLRECIASLFRRGASVKERLKPLAVKLVPRRLWLARKRRIFVNP